MTRPARRCGPPSKATAYPSANPGCSSGVHEGGGPVMSTDRGDVPYLLRFSWTEIVRHQMVQTTASADDPDLTDYSAARRRRVKPPLDSYTVRLLDRQHGRCPLCGDHLLTADQPPQSPREWERWWLAVTRKAVQHDYLVHNGRPRGRGTPDGDQTRLTCARFLPAVATATLRQQDQHITPTVLGGCLSRMLGKRARPVLRGPWRSNAPGLPDRPISRAACGKRSSTRYRAAVTRRSVRNGVPAGIRYRFGAPAISPSLPGATRSDARTANPYDTPRRSSHRASAGSRLKVSPIATHGVGLTPPSRTRLIIRRASSGSVAWRTPGGTRSHPPASVPVVHDGGRYSSRSTSAQPRGDAYPRNT